MNAITQSNSNGDILEHKIQLKVATTGKQRGPQKAKAKVADNLSITKRVDEYYLLKGETYLKLSSGNLLPEACEHLYRWFGSARAPKAWREAMARTAPGSFSKVQRAREEMTHF